MAGLCVELRTPVLNRFFKFKDKTSVEVAVLLYAISVPVWYSVICLKCYLLCIAVFLCYTDRKAAQV